MFIDGLDEFDGRYDAVIEVIDSLAKQFHVKICLSSRPLSNFEKAFADQPKLRLQDMTRDSIRAYAHVQLLDEIQRRFKTDLSSQDQAKKLLNNIVWRADGVFLWVVIAVRDVREGLQDCADLNGLARAIEELPERIDDLYMRMLNRIKPAYRRDAARFLQIVLYGNLYYDGLDLCKLYFIDT